MILGVRKDGLVITDKNRKELMYLEYAHIASWGVNSSTLVLVIQKTEYQLKKIYLDSYTTKILQLLISCYTSLLTF